MSGAGLTAGGPATTLMPASDAFGPVRAFLLLVVLVAPLAAASGGSPRYCTEEPVHAAANGVYVGADGHVYLEDNDLAGLQSKVCMLYDGGGTYTVTWVQPDVRLA